MAAAHSGRGGPRGRVGYHGHAMDLNERTRNGGPAVIDTSRWPRVSLDVLTEIHLDPRNVRLDGIHYEVEADIMADLFANEGALDLIEGIVTVGYLTFETPVVVKDGDRNIVVEGNRRVAALKAIQNPMLVPSHQTRIAALIEAIPDRPALTRLEVLVAPSRDEADQMIAAIHAGKNLRKAWTPARQAAFFEAQIAAGRTMADLLTRYPTANVRRFVLRAGMIRRFRQVKYEDPALTSFLAERDLASGLSTLARVYESKEFQELIGLRLESDGSLTMSVSAEVFDAMATTMVQGLVDGDLNTRSLNRKDAPRFQMLLSELTRLRDEASGVAGEKAGGRGRTASASSAAHGLPPGQSSGDKRSSASQPSASDGSSSSDGRATAAAKRPRRRLTRYLDPPPVPDRYPAGVRECVNELSGLNVVKFPNIAFVALRTILERSLKAYAELESRDIKAERKIKRKYVYLEDCLEWLESYVDGQGASNLKAPIRMVLASRLVAYPGSKESLDAAQHNPHLVAEPDQVIAAWNGMESIMRFLMRP